MHQLSSLFTFDPVWIVDDLQDAANPHRGWHHQEYTECSTTWHTNNNYGIPSEVLYDRFPVDEIIDMTCTEDSDGVEICICEISTAYIDDQIAAAEAAGQKFTFRFYFYGLFRDSLQQTWAMANSYKLEKCGFTGAIGAQRTGVDTYGDTEWVPDLQADDLVEFHADLLEELAKYDGHPSIDYIEVGSAGHYGEWHAANLWTDANGDGLLLDDDDYHVGGIEFAWEDASLPYSGQIIKDYFEHFEHTPLVMQIGGKWDVNRNRFNYVMDTIGRYDFGIRGDGFGDSGRYGTYRLDSSYSHQVYDSVFQYVHTDGTCRFINQWQRGPILFEVAFAGYYQWFQFEKNYPIYKGSYIEDIIQKGKDYHLSILNNKNSYIPGFNCPGNPYYIDSKWTPFTSSEMVDIKLRIQETLPEFLHAYGYKIQIEDWHIPPYDISMHSPGCPIPEIKVKWNNIGVAPCYYDYYWCLKIMNEFESDICSEGYVLLSDVSIKGVLPNFEDPEIPIFPSSSAELSFIPQFPNTGDYEIYIGLVRPGDLDPKIYLTNENVPVDDNCRWHHLGTAEVSATEGLVMTSPPALTLSYHYETNGDITSSQTIGDPDKDPDDIKNMIVVDYEAGFDNSIILEPEFEIAEGVLFETFFDGCVTPPID